MADWLHSLASLAHAVSSGHPSVAAWALPAWLRLYPTGDLPLLATRLGDGSTEEVLTIAQHLAEQDDPVWTTVLQTGFDLAKGKQKAAYVPALTTRRQDADLHRLLRGLREARDGGQLFLWLQAIAQWANDDSWKAIQPLLRRLEADDAFASHLVRWLLAHGRRADVAGVVAAWRSWAPNGESQSPVAGALLDWLGLREDLLRPLARLGAEEPDEVLDAAETLLGHPAVDDALLDALDEGWAAGWTGFHKACLQALHRHLADHWPQWTDHVRASAGQPATTPAQLPVAADALLTALCQGSPRQGREQVEAQLALGTLLAVTTSSYPDPVDDADPLGTQWRRFDTPKRQLSPQVLDTLEALDTHLAVHLCRRLGAIDAVAVRAAHALGAAPPTDEAIQALALALQEHRLSDPVCDALTQSLAQWGPTWVDALALATLGRPSPAWCRVLAPLPTEGVAQALLQAAERGWQVEPYVMDALIEAAPREALEALSPHWRPTNLGLAAGLVFLAHFHDLHPSDLPAWQATLRASAEA